MEVVVLLLAAIALLLASVAGAGGGGNFYVKPPYDPDRDGPRPPAPKGSGGGWRKD